MLRSLGARLPRQFGFRIQVSRCQDDEHDTICGLNVRPVRTVLDIGANNGASALWFRSVFPAAIVHSFEPLPSVFADLERVAAQSQGMIRAYQVALGEDTGRRVMFMHEKHPSSSSFLASSPLSKGIYPSTVKQVQVPVQVERLDEMVDGVPIGLTNEVFIKLDVQGFELNVLRGGRKVLSRTTGVMLEVSLLSLYQGQPSFYEVASFMRESGFAFRGCVRQDVVRGGEVAAVDAVFCREGV